eukprot:CAMPEP_0182447214 /NCGR_PEP_ID=MMETSP1172-20130603/12853_1 /TAXON_ID=708627 /ORGANISM="Timspurckia oligopyrenoides, Strain CCMP3278" /LENGTH=518 /DNA_ID=CAMNT_0024643567 /DNA_START=383 /DNA_END=1939 /DNA_ORIENTATION=+
MTSPRRPVSARADLGSTENAALAPIPGKAPQPPVSARSELPSETKNNGSFGDKHAPRIGEKSSGRVAVNNASGSSSGRIHLNLSKDRDNTRPNKPSNQPSLLSGGSGSPNFRKIPSQDYPTQNEPDSGGSLSRLTSRDDDAIQRGASRSFSSRTRHLFGSSRAASKSNREFTEEDFRQRLAILTFEDEKGGKSGAPGTPDCILYRAGYDMHEKIGIGGQAEVYRGTRRVDGMLVAIKISVKRMPNDSDAVAARRLQYARREVEILAVVCSHRGIVDLIETFEDEKFVYVILEYLPGPDLKNLFQTSNLSETQCLIIMRQVVGAISHLHSYGIAHRDLKFENVCFVSTDPFQNWFDLRVIDLGMAHSEIHEKNSEITSRAGTFQWMPPEQIFREKHKATVVDIWAIGIMLFALIEKSYPFYAKSLEELAENIRTVDLKKKMFSTSPDVQSVVLMHLERDNEKRPTAAESVKLFDGLLQTRKVNINFNANRLGQVSRVSIPVKSFRSASRMNTNNTTTGT